MGTSSVTSQPIPKNELKKPEDWLKTDEFLGIEVLDPDGWDRNNIESSWNKPITKEEMRRRLAQSTVRYP